MSFFPRTNILLIVIPAFPTTSDELYNRWQRWRTLAIIWRSLFRTSRGIGEAATNQGVTALYIIQKSFYNLSHPRWLGNISLPEWNMCFINMSLMKNWIWAVLLLWGGGGWSVDDGYWSVSMWKTARIFFSMTFKILWWVVKGMLWRCEYHVTLIEPYWPSLAI